MLAGRYRLSGVLGRGGMGTVWRAYDEQLGREVAVKELRLPDELDAAQRESWIARVDREARAAARLKHPGVITVHDRITTADGRPWIVMELVHGRSLDDLLRAEGPLTPEAAARIGLHILTALRATHSLGITHRDIKPSNVLLEGDRVVLTDFGIAAVEGDVTLTSSGAIMGTPAYMAPEQVRGRPATAESDLWSLGATLFHATEGQPPFNATSVGALFVAVATEDPAPAVHAGPLTPVLQGLLRKDPAQRLTADAAHALLAELARDTAHLSGPPQLPAEPPTMALSAADSPAARPTRQATVPSDGIQWPAAGLPPAPTVSPRTASGPTGRARMYLLVGLAAATVTALVAVAAMQPWRDSPTDTNAGADGGKTSAPATQAPTEPTPSQTTPSGSDAGSDPTETDAPEPTHEPLDRKAINRIFKIYMDGLADQDMTALRSGTCPRYRSGLLGFALNDYYVYDWELLPYDIPEGADELSVEARITQQDINTGKPAGDVLNQWIIERDADGDYWVCGWLNEK